MASHNSPYEQSHSNQYPPYEHTSYQQINHGQEGQYQQPIQYQQPQLGATPSQNTYTASPHPPSYSHFDSSEQQALHNSGLSDSDIQEEQILLDSTLQWIPSQPAPTQSYIRLEKPVAIPRINIPSRLKPPIPFLRAYSPALAAHDINPTDFLAFIDNLTIAQNAAPPFQALQLAGQGLSFVPHHIPALVGVSLQVASGAASTVTIVIRTKKFLAKVNEEYFAPRGLKVGLKKDPELGKMVGVPDGVAPPDARRGCISLRDRRLRALEGYISPLDFDVPPPTVQGNVLDRLSAKQVAHKVGKQEKGLRKKREKMIETDERLERIRSNPRFSGGVADEDYFDDGSSSDSGKSFKDAEKEIGKLEKKIQKIDLKAQKELADKGSKDAEKIEKKRQKELIKVEKDSRKVEEEMAKKLGKRKKKSGKNQGKNVKKVARMEYIVIENL